MKTFYLIYAMQNGIVSAGVAMKFECNGIASIKWTDRRFCPLEILGQKGFYWFERLHKIVTSNASSIQEHFGDTCRQFALPHDAGEPFWITEVMTAENI